MRLVSESPESGDLGPRWLCGDALPLSVLICGQGTGEAQRSAAWGPVTVCPWSPRPFRPARGTEGTKQPLPGGRRVGSQDRGGAQPACRHSHPVWSPPAAGGPSAAGCPLLPFPLPLLCLHLPAAGSPEARSLGDKKESIFPDCRPSGLPLESPRQSSPRSPSFIHSPARCPSRPGFLKATPF